MSNGPHQCGKEIECVTGELVEFDSDSSGSDMRVGFSECLHLLKLFAGTTGFCCEMNASADGENGRIRAQNKISDRPHRVSSGSRGIHIALERQRRPA